MVSELQKMRDRLMAKKGNKGFTLVELIVVIVILAILVGVTIGGVYGYVSKSRINTDINNASAIGAALAPITTMKGVELDGATSGTAFALGAATTKIEAADVQKALKLKSSNTDFATSVQNMFPQGIEPTKSGADYYITYTIDAKTGYITSVSCFAGTAADKPLVAEE